MNEYFFFVLFHFICMAMPINAVSRMHSRNSNVRYILFLINFWRALRSYDGIVHDFFIGI